MYNTFKSPDIVTVKCVDLNGLGMSQEWTAWGQYRGYWEANREEGEKEEDLEQSGRAVLNWT